MRNYRVKTSNLALLIFDLDRSKNADVLAEENCPQIRLYEKLPERDFGANAYLDIEKSIVKDEMFLVRVKEKEETSGLAIQKFDIFDREGTDVSKFLKDKNSFFIKEGEENNETTNQFLAGILKGFSSKQSLVRQAVNHSKIKNIANGGLVRAGLLYDFIEEYNMFNFIEKIRADKKERKKIDMQVEM